MRNEVCLPGGTVELAECCKHIPTEEVRQDIADTEAEITTMEREIEAYRLLGDKLSMFRVSARELGIKSRRQFIRKLEGLIAYRESIGGEP